MVSPARIWRQLLRAQWAKFSAGGALCSPPMAPSFCYGRRITRCGGAYPFKYGRRMRRPYYAFSVFSSVGRAQWVKFAACGVPVVRLWRQASATAAESLAVAGRTPLNTGDACVAPTMAFSVFSSVRPATAALQRPRDERWRHIRANGVLPQIGGCPEREKFFSRPMIFEIDRFCWNKNMAGFPAWSMLKERAARNAAYPSSNARECHCVYQSNSSCSSTGVAHFTGNTAV